MSNIITLPGRTGRPAPAEPEQERERCRRAVLQVRDDLLAISSRLTELKSALGRLHLLLADDGK